MNRHGEKSEIITSSLCKKKKKKKKKKMQWGQEKITKTNKHEFNPEQNKPKLTKQIKQLKQ